MDGARLSRFPHLSWLAFPVAGNASGDDARLDGHHGELARRLILRLCELNGMPSADWRDDVSVFSRRTLDVLVAYIDAHLKISPSIADLAALVGMSPSHCAKKFRQSTGLSVHRFVNRRRVRRALELLKARPWSLEATAAVLGFSSQSHFTRVFRGLTGMTPAKYRRQFKPTVG